MNHPTRLLTLIIILVIAPLTAHAATPTAAPRTPAKLPASPAAPAVSALLTEYQSAMKDKKGEGLRTKSNYFTNSNSEGMTPEVILDQLEKPIPGADPRAESYIKWQLLSAINGKFPETLQPRATKAYRAAPVPPPHPGANHQALDKALMRMGPGNADKEVAINKELNDHIEAWRDDIKPFVAYRDDFYSRLTPNYDTFEAAFFDIYNRVSRGVPALEVWKDLSDVIRKWALTSNNPQQMRAIAADLNQLHKLVNDEKNKPYYRVIYQAGNNNAANNTPRNTPGRNTIPGRYNNNNNNYNDAGLKWQSEGVLGNTKNMGEISDWLTEHAKNAPAK